MLTSRQQNFIDLISNNSQKLTREQTIDLITTTSNRKNGIVMLTHEQATDAIAGKHVDYNFDVTRHRIIHRRHSYSTTQENIIQLLDLLAEETIKETIKNLTDLEKLHWQLVSLYHIAAVARCELYQEYINNDLLDTAIRTLEQQNQNNKPQQETTLEWQVNQFLIEVYATGKLKLCDQAWALLEKLNPQAKKINGTEKILSHLATEEEINKYVTNPKFVVPQKIELPTPRSSDRVVHIVNFDTVLIYNQYSFEYLVDSISTIENKIHRAKWVTLMISSGFTARIRTLLKMLTIAAADTIIGLLPDTKEPGILEDIEHLIQKYSPSALDEETTGNPIYLITHIIAAALPRETMLQILNQALARNSVSPLSSIDLLDPYYELKNHIKNEQFVQLIRHVKTSNTPLIDALLILGSYFTSEKKYTPFVELTKPNKFLAKALATPDEFLEELKASGLNTETDLITLAKQGFALDLEDAPLGTSIRNRLFYDVLQFSGLDFKEDRLDTIHFTAIKTALSSADQVTVAKVMATLDRIQGEDLLTQKSLGKEKVTNAIQTVKEYAEKCLKKLDPTTNKVSNNRSTFQFKNPFGSKNKPDNSMANGNEILNNL